MKRIALLLTAILLLLSVGCCTTKDLSTDLIDTEKLKADVQAAVTEYQLTYVTYGFSEDGRAEIKIEFALGDSEINYYPISELNHKMYDFGISKDIASSYEIQLVDGDGTVIYHLKNDLDASKTTVEFSPEGKDSFLDVEAPPDPN